ncbi:hypothetical protein CTI12_AA229700 [Artemisia annua]|uniref:Uncharacterized protein n=1 Tax=Artemisia annua TaxID=35608 RepID=A0A2U1NTA1_ARTAN|nr:hypothetical protein CTI12_AA229700 [Artemisia annua]
MVPKVYRDLSPCSYTPRVVSIGPLHHEDEHLIGFEVQKAAYVHNLLCNLSSLLDSTPEQILEECVWKVSDSVDKIKACYVAMPTYSDSELVKMMVTDSCFVLAFLYKYDIGYSSSGPIQLLYTHIVLDIVLIENQIPYFVLQDIFECTLLKLCPTESLTNFIFPIHKFCKIFSGDLVMDNSSISSTHDHILGFLHKSYQNPESRSGDVELGHVDIDDTLQDLLKYDGVEVQNPSDQHAGSIFMVPSGCRDISPRSFTPRVVSLGPLHHQDEHLKGFEVQKATYMHNLFHNVLRPLDSTPEQILKECVTKAYSDSELVKMMVTDACFILTFLYDDVIGYSSLGPIELLGTKIHLDILLIENQIPFFVLQDIYECTFSKLLPTLTLANFIIQILKGFNIFAGDLVMDNSGISSTYDHILGFLHKSYQNSDRDSSILRKLVKAHSVVELDRSGVRFSNKLDAKWPMAMELELSRLLCFPLSWSTPTLKMPILSLGDNSELIIRNLIIYEHSAQVQTCVTSYMLAMDHLIDTPEDVAKLVRSQVLVNYIGSNEEAADLINNICKEVPLKDFYYQDEWEKLDEYYNAYWPNLIAELRRNYFSNPWSIIALIAGIILFILTVVQTVYGVKAA